MTLPDAAVVAKIWLDRAKNEPDHNRSASLTQVFRDRELAIWSKFYKYLKHATTCPEWAVTHLPKSLCNCGLDVLQRTYAKAPGKHQAIFGECECAWLTYEEKIAHAREEVMRGDASLSAATAPTVPPAKETQG